MIIWEGGQFLKCIVRSSKEDSKACYLIVIDDEAELGGTFSNILACNGISSCRQLEVSARVLS